MGYEIKMFVGKTGLSLPEFERDLTKPYSDGSGFEYIKDERGEPIQTGRIENYFSVYAMVDLCKLGYRKDALNDLIQKSFAKSNTESGKIWYFYESDGNTKIKEDRYGDKFYPVPIKDVLAAIEKTINPKEPYRRLEWAKALLASMVDDVEELEVIFFGY